MACEPSRGPGDSSGGGGPVGWTLGFARGIDTVRLRFDSVRRPASRGSPPLWRGPCIEPARKCGWSLRPAAPIGVSDEAGNASRLTKPIILGDDRSDDVTILALGSLGMRIHGEPGTDRLWLRTWDEDHPERGTFELPDQFPVDASWRLAARFEPYPEPRGLPVSEVTGGMIEYRTPGELVFRLDGQEHRLVATANEDSRSFFVMIWDSTATSTTYQASRYLRAPLPDAEGWTTIDFNRAYNAPCVFTAYSVCALPPRQNWLPVAITAGEQRPEKPPY